MYMYCVKIYSWCTVRIHIYTCTDMREGWVGEEQGDMAHVHVHKLINFV